MATFALDALLDAGFACTTALVLHLSPVDPRVKRALAQLSAEFAGDQYRGRPVHFRHLPLAAQGAPLTAITGGREAEAVWAMARDLLAHLKADGQRLQLCIAGGPRLLALTLTSAAMLHCDHQDRLWHLYTPKSFIAQAREGAILHAPPEAGVRLVPVPFAPWGVYFPALRQLAQPLGATPPLLDPDTAAKCAQAWAELTDRQRDVARALAGGALPQEAAAHLHITLKTLDSHKTQILATCRLVWGLPEDDHLTYHFLRETFGAWLTLPGILDSL